MKKWLIMKGLKIHQFLFKAKGEKFHFACCDCGLVHDMAVALENPQQIGIAFRRNQKMTERNRNSWKKKPVRSK